MSSPTYIPPEAATVPDRGLKGGCSAMAGSAWVRKRKIGFLFWILTGGAGLGLSFACFVDYGNGWVPLLIAIPFTFIGMFNNWPAKVCKKRPLLFSQRKGIAAEAEQWCKDHNCPASPLNIVTAISSLKLMDEPNTDSQAK